MMDIVDLAPRYTKPAKCKGTELQPLYRTVHGEDFTLAKVGHAIFTTTKPCEEEPHKLLEIAVDVNGNVTHCLIDSGATHCFVATALVKTTGIPVFKGSELSVTLADGIKFLSNDCARVPLMLRDDQLILEVECCMIKTLTSPVVLGMDWLIQYNPCIDWPTYTVELDTEKSPLVLMDMPAGLDAKVELCSAKAIAKDLQWEAIAWFALLKDIIEPTGKNSLH